MRQIFFTGLQAIRLLALGAILFGVFTVVQSASQLTRIGGMDSIGNILIAAFLREVGPLLTLIVVIARSVSAIASEISSMKANGEIDSLRSMGVSPLSYLVVPRVVSGAISVLILGMHFVWIALVTGYLSALIFVDISVGRFLNSILYSLQPADLWIFFLKTFVLGSLVFLIACYCGLRTTGAHFEIPQATTKAVVWSFTFCFVLQVLISCVYYFVLFRQAGLLPL